MEKLTHNDKIAYWNYLIWKDMNRWIDKGLYMLSERDYVLQGVIAEHYRPYENEKIQ